MKTMIEVVAVSVLVIAGWGSGLNGAIAAERAIPPSATDPAINLGSGAHVVATPASAETASGRLFVFLPGTNVSPRSYSFILRAAAKNGHHVAGLLYLSSLSIGSLCGTSTEVDCYWDARREVVTGEDLSPLLAVDKANSIVNRLEKLLTYLATRYPREHWEQFLLPDGSVNWSLVAVGGHSQGGGHAGVMAKLYWLHRACYFASPADWSKTIKGPAPWSSEPPITSADSQYGFTHLLDKTAPYPLVSSQWASMGLQAFGSAVSIDGQPAPYGSSHELTTNAEPNLSGTTNPYHSATVVDAATPIAANGTPVYEPVWNYMCFQ
jgi:hypothetical protein